MVDTINIKNDLEHPPKQVLELQKTHFDWCGFTWIPVFKDSSQPPIYYYVKVKNLYLKLIGHQLLVSNSLHKLYHNNNYKPFTYSQVVEAFEILNNHLPINIFDSKIIKLSAGVVIEEDSQKVVDEWQYFLGKKFTTGMLPSENMPTMNTFKDKNPAKNDVKNGDINKFIEDQKNFLTLLNKARNTDLNKNNCKLTIPIVKMRLGDTLKFYTYHNVRHIAQAQKAIATN